jgi:urease accessory protein
MNNFSRPAIEGSRLILAGLFSTFAVSAIPSLAYAHHPTGGMTPATFAEGLLSGLAHPIIGPDHLVMLLLVGAYCGAYRQGIGPLVSFVVAASIGCLAHAARLDLPHVETGIAVSLLVLGIAACAISGSSRGTTAVVLGAVGLLHGYAYGEAIVGAETSPLVAYLLGLSLVQLGVASLLSYITRPRDTQAVRPPRIAFVRAVGVASALVGIIALTLQIVRPV